MKKRSSHKGFTLIELMICVAIIAVITAIAYPSYMSSVRKVNRAEAKAALMDAAQRLQRCYTIYGTYNNAGCAVLTDLAGNGGLGIPSRDKGYYNVSLAQGITTTTYQLIATAAKSPQTADTACLTMKLDQLGVRLPAAPAPCW
jgi:type IV pilus assembly protein PilE